ncbi:hypothetical protein C2E20_6881 isoform A [Micractinium conductrix]|uniref:Uncharacterized protein n=1 Tax=Micractinium conductrix TaxID=554055 RepID=A0A2P6V6C5_9CHLO|nr:hypothetical protein C2E20_6881 isoform A [Micractinium conductrix]|eukprot:PSC69644.1 hypothetical protein C2E20_6881 isoform A [Micractinium conductrix]
MVDREQRHVRALAAPVLSSLLAAQQLAPRQEPAQQQEAEQQAQQQTQQQEAEQQAQQQTQQHGQQQSGHLSPQALLHLMEAFPQRTRSLEEAAQPPARPPPSRNDGERLERRIGGHLERAHAALATLTTAQLLARDAPLPVLRHCLLGQQLSDACALLDDQAREAGLPSWRDCHLDHVWPLALLCMLTQLLWGLTLLNLCPSDPTANMKKGSHGLSRVLDKVAAESEAHEADVQRLFKARGLAKGRLRLHGGRGQRGWAPGERAAVEQCLQLSPELDLLTSYTLWAGSPLTSEWLGVAYNRRQRAWEGYLDSHSARVYDLDEDACAARRLLRWRPDLAREALALPAPPGQQLPQRVERLQQHLLRCAVLEAPRQAFARCGGGVCGGGGGGGAWQAGAGPLLLDALLSAFGAPEQAAGAAEAAAAEQGGVEEGRTEEQSLARRLLFHLQRTLAVLCLAPPQLLRSVRVPPRSRVLCGRSLAWWCGQLRRGAQQALGHLHWRLGVLDHVYCLALAMLPAQLDRVMSMANLRVLSRLDNAQRGSAGWAVLLLPSGEPRWRRLPSGETTAEKPAAVAEVEAEAERHWQHQELMLAAAPQPPPTGQDRLRQCDEGAPIFDSIAEARDVADEELLNLSVYCGVAAREVTG